MNVLCCVMAFLLYIHGNDASVFLFCSLCLKCLSGHNACMHWTKKKKTTIVRPVRPLCQQSGGIAEYAYFSGWHESGKCAVRLKPYIIMIMTQSLHPCKLTAGKFAGVDLETFLKVYYMLGKMGNVKIIFPICFFVWVVF